MKVAISFSGGKDSTLALDRAVQEGHEPVALFVMINEPLGRSWFHGIDPGLLQALSASLQLPLILCPCRGEDYHTALEQGLLQARAMGAQGCVFGDMDILEHAAWSRARCSHTGLQALFPLWGRTRRENAFALLERGYRCVIKCVKNGVLPQSLLGQVLNRDLLLEMERQGVDLCGENGEYHTLVVDGPLFSFPIPYERGKILNFGTISAIDLYGPAPKG